jgi:hypothetical protein
MGTVFLLCIHFEPSAQKPHNMLTLTFDLRSRPNKASNMPNNHKKDGGGKEDTIKY